MTGDEIRLDVLLSRIAGEVGSLRDTALTAEATVFDVISGTVGPGGASSTLQELDRLSQTLGDLSQILSALSTSCPADGTVEAAKVMASAKLVSLTHRLLCVAQTSPANVPDVELF